MERRRVDTGAIAWRHGVRIDERRAVGLYYGHKTAFTLFSSLLQETVATASPARSTSPGVERERAARGSRSRRS